jgi:hypothetical protein
MGWPDRKQEHDALEKGPFANRDADGGEHPDEHDIELDEDDWDEEDELSYDTDEHSLGILKDDEDVDD